MEYDIADIIDVRETSQFLRMMQEIFEEQIGDQRFFRITGTPAAIGEIPADLDNPDLVALLTHPPNPHGRRGGWDARPLPPLKRTAIGFENERINFHHMKFIKNGHLEFWTAIDPYFCWQQDPGAMEEHPRLYPYAVVEHPLSFIRLYRALIDLLRIEDDVIFQMEYLNVKGAILLPYAPESLGFMAPMDPIKPLGRSRLVLPQKRFPRTFEPDPSALEIIKDLYYEFGYNRAHIPFFDHAGQSVL
jgi:hypothetical protein